MDISNDQLIEINSEKPRTVKADGVDMTEVSSMPTSANEWYHDSGQNKLFLMASLTPITTSTTTTTTSTTTTIHIPPSADYIVTGSPSDYKAINATDSEILLVDPMQQM